MSEMRTWGKATRDTAEGKLDFHGFYDRNVLVSFAEYMNRHRKQADGSMRDSDNWKEYFGDNHYGVCFESAFRHFMDFWAEHDGEESRDGMDEAINGLLFNIFAYQSKRLKEQREHENDQVKLSVFERDLSVDRDKWEEFMNAKSGKKTIVKKDPNCIELNDKELKNFIKKMKVKKDVIQ